MSEPRPQLRAVEHDAEPVEGDARGGQDAKGPLLWIAIGLAVALCAAVIGWISADQRAGTLEATLAATHEQLDETRRALVSSEAAVEAHEVHLDSLRERVGVVRSELGALEALLAEDPVAAPAQNAP